MSSSQPSDAHSDFDASITMSGQPSLPHLGPAGRTEGAAVGLVVGVEALSANRVADVVAGPR